MKRQYTMKLVEAIPNITEEKTLPAASSDTAGIVEEAAAAKTTPPVVTEISFPKYKLAPLLREPALDASVPGGIIESQAPHKLRAIQKIMKTPHLVSPYYKGLVENGDGKISLAELPQCLDAEAAGAFIDTDGDGLLASDDFVKLVHGRNEENKVNGFKGAFELYEMDDLVSQAPKLRAIQKNGEKPRLRKVSPFEHLFKACDENGDGKISPAELRQCLDAETAGAFIDTDGNGLLGFDDFVKLVHGRNEENKVNDFKGAFESYEMDDLVSQDPKASRGTDRLPVSRRDLKNITLQQKYLNCTAIGRMLDISPQHHGILLMLFGSILSYLAKTSTTPFEFQVGKTKITPESLLSFHEAFYGFIPEIAHITVFMICYILTWRLVLPLQPGVQIFLVLLLISAPLFYFPDLIRKASTLGVDVSCGSSFKLPLIGFTCIAAFGITLTFGLLTLLVVYLNRRFIHGRKPTRGQDIEVNSNDLINV